MQAFGERQSLEDQFDAMLQAERLKSREAQSTRDARLRNMPVLWRGVVTMHDHRLQGPVMLRGSHVGATVEVLEERQGAGERYLTARDVDSGSTGLILESWVRRDARS